MHENADRAELSGNQMFTSNETSTIHRGEINDSELRSSVRIQLLLTTKGVLNHAYNQAFSRIWRLQDNFVIVGLPDAAVKESRDRVMTALINSGFAFTFGRTTINLAPADVKKEGPSFDLPIALGMIAASEQMESDRLDQFVMVGELALTGAVATLIAN